jgi:hypothetical protein
MTLLGERMKKERSNMRIVPCRYHWRGGKRDRDRDREKANIRKARGEGG